ncbi:MAG: Ig-like domain repeat protein [Nocardioides sp.]|nr:Ig-like domain repeat protein [Nocardioides sp.]
MLHTTSRRLAATVAATALGAGALVAMAAPAANAATTATTYTCNFPSLGAKDIPVSITATLPPAANAGLDAPAIPVLLAVTLPKEVVDAARGLFGATTIGGFSNDMTATLTEGTSTTSSADLGLENVKFPQTAVPATTGQPLTITTPNPLVAGTTPATTKATNLPDAGTYNINVPSAFKFTATKQGDAVMLADVPCALKAGSPSTLGSITLAKNESATTGKAAKKITPVGKLAKVKVAVDADNEIPSGTVKVLKGKKVLGKGTLKSTGKVTVKLKKALPAGVTKVTVSYLGDGYTEVSKSKKIKIKVG